MEVYKVNHYDEWKNTRMEAYQSDFYHSHPYHALAEERGEGVAQMWVYREGGYMIALPLLVRSLADVDGFEEEGSAWYDAVSVYGYVGPIASHQVIPPAIVRNFQAALATKLREQRVISVFSRLHPLIPTGQLIDGLGEQIEHGSTIAIDLSVTPDEQWRQFRLNHRRQISRLRRHGYTFFHDDEREALGEFVSIYTETMTRVDAEEKYFFDDAYFSSLLDGRLRNSHLFFLLDQGTPVCGGVFVECGGILEFHLGGTRNHALARSPMKLLVDEVRLWATARCFRSLHLGGGKDSLFHFKAGFSDRSHPFTTWQWVTNHAVHDEACRRRAAFDRQHGREPAPGRFFPPYRSPLKPGASPNCCVAAAGALS
ncbi:MAG TPA: GNAT family N-acetyltransferase [Chthoniobacteraceae bacterium]|nr:GNAT family N-acetyltransferase [Chthoniobacteraceae bacterium]